jgi:hypothetical protein
VTTQLQVARGIGVDGRFTNLPAEWLQDQWFFPKGELAGVGGSLPEGARFDWTGIHPTLAAQLKWAVATRCLSGQWRAQNLAAMHGVVKRLMCFLREDASELSSMLDRPLDTWLVQLRSHLVARNEYRATRFSALVRSAPGGVKEYIREDVTVRLFRQLYSMIAQELDPRDEYDKDVWNLRRLGIAGRASATINYLNFTRIAQPWLKQAIKRYCQYTLVRGAPSSCHEWILVANKFSEYLAERYPELAATQL